MNEKTTPVKPVENQCKRPTPSDLHKKEQSVQPMTEAEVEEAVEIINPDPISMESRG